MIKMVIVDDEPVILDSLATLIDWTSIGVEVVGTADNGAAAIEITLKQQPDIILSDISMPFFSGLEMLQTLRQHNVSAEVIFITAYSRFEYAREAIHYGAFEYILKPINEDLLLQTVARCADKIRSETRDRRALDGIAEGKLQQCNQILLNCLLHGEIPNESEKKTLTRFFPNISSYLFAVVLGRWHDGYGSFEHLFVPPESLVVPLAVSEGHDLLLFLAHTPYDEAVLRSLIDEPPVGVLYALSEPNETEKCLKQAYTQICFAMLAARTHYIKIAFFSDYSKQEPFFGGYENAHLIIGQYVANGDTDSIVEMLYHFFFLLLINDDIYDLSMVKLRCIALVDHIINEAAKFIFSEFLEDPEKTLSVKKSVNACGTLSSVYEVTLNLLVNFTSYALEAQARSGKRIIRQTVEYIHEHFASDISLATAASHLYVSPAYLSRVFSAEMKEPFSNYLQSYRIEQAKKMLLNTNDKIYEVAEKVGYTNIAHFSKMFRKITGVTPNQYRNKY